jgi:hypothetical protein
MSVRRLQIGSNMRWVIICTIVAWLVVNTPMLYGLIVVHHWSGMKELWGFAPNQFWFLALVFPIACLGTFTALHILTARLHSAVLEEHAGVSLLNDWIPYAAVCVIIAAGITIIDYVWATKTFDKLRPPYAGMAVATFRELDTSRNLASGHDPERTEPLKLEAAQETLTRMDLSGTDPSSTLKQLSQAEPLVKIAAFQNIGYQRRLGLLDPGYQVCCALQMLMTLFVAGCTILAMLQYRYARELQLDVGQGENLDRAYRAIVVAACCYGVYALVFRFQKAQVDVFLRSRPGILQDSFSALAVVALLLWLGTLKHNDNDVMSVVSRFSPVLIFGAGVTTLRHQPLRQAIGTETNPGIQLLWCLGAILVISVVATIIRPRG